MYDKIFTTISSGSKTTMIKKREWRFYFDLNVKKYLCYKIE